MNIDFIYQGNAPIDGIGGWIIGDKQLPDTIRKQAGLLVKYGLHPIGQECARPFEAWTDKNKSKLTVSILVSGGPFVHRFRLDEGAKTPFPCGLAERKTILTNIGDYVIYSPDVLHTWKAVNDSVVITVQIPAENSVSPTLTS